MKRVTNGELENEQLSFSRCIIRKVAPLPFWYESGKYLYVQGSNELSPDLLPTCSVKLMQRNYDCHKQSFTPFAYFRYGLKGPVYFKDKAGQVVTPHITDDSVIFGPGEKIFFSFQVTSDVFTLVVKFSL